MTSRAALFFLTEAVAMARIDHAAIYPYSTILRLLHVVLPASSMQKAELLNHILKLRIAVGRHGEMDRAEWWNTRGIMGSKGGVVLERGFPRTHPLVQARIAFSVAEDRCKSVFTASDTATLWSLPAELEDQFESNWSQWLSQGDLWDNFLEKVNGATEEGLTRGLKSLGLIEQVHVDQAMEADRQGASAQISSDVNEVDGGVASTLAASFALGGENDLVVPFITLSA